MNHFRIKSYIWFRKHVFYGWIVCGVCTLLLFVTMGTASNGLSVFMPHIMREYALSNAQTSSLVTLRCVTALIAMFVIGKYYDRIGFRIGTGISALCCTAAYIIYSISSGYAGFCIGAAVAGVSYGLGSMIPVAILMGRWFVKHRALAISICSAGTSAATIILPPVLTGVVLKTSLRTAFLFTAMYTAVFALLVFLLIRDTPSDMRLEALGRRERLHELRAKQQGRQAEAWKPTELSRKGWLLLGAVSVMMGALANSGFLHLTVLYTSEGFSAMTVALFLSVTGIVMTFFKIAFGEAADRLGGYKTTAIFSAILFGGYSLCCLSCIGSVPLMMTDAVLLGIGYPIATIGIPVWASDLVSQDRYADAVRRLQVAYAAGALAFSLCPGVIADTFGSYIPVYVLFTALIVISFVCLSLVYRRKRMRNN